MTEDKIALRALLEQGSDATFLREMIGFAAERLMQLETEGLCGGHMVSAARPGATSAMGIVTETGKPGLARRNCEFPSCAAVPTFPASSSPGRWPRKRWRR